MRRARQSHQKLERREAILSVALATLESTPFPDITMAQMAEQAGLVKGTLYLFFSTKEELFLEVLRDQFHGWFWDLETGIKALPNRNRIEAAARLFAEVTVSRHSFRVLIGILHGVLEHNLPETTARSFKREQLGRIAAMGGLLERTLPFLHKGQGIRLLQQIQALIIGLQALAEPSEMLRKVMTQPDLAPLRLDLAQELQEGIEALMIGFREGNRRRIRGTPEPE
jgi:AcrR family transcriptional regulator